MSAHAKNVRELGVGLLVTHPDNPRAAGSFDDLSGLRDSISAHGILSPLIVRPLGDSYQVVCGHRRLACAEELQISAVPCFVRELTDAEALEVQLVENLQREDLHPLEEAEALQRLLTTGSHTSESLAAAIGKSRSYVAGRLRLASLTEAAKDILRRDPGAVATALLVARIPDPKLQLKAAKEILEGITRWIDGKAVAFPMPAREAAELIRKRYMLTLADAPFALADEHLLPEAGACTRCPHRTGCSTDLFGDIADADLCTNPPCFGRKVAAGWDQTAKLAQAQKHPTAEIMPLIKATRAGEKYNGTYVRISEKDGSDRDKRTFKQIAAAKSVEPRIYLARGEKGGVVPVYHRAEFDALVAGKKPKKAAADHAAPTPAEKHDWQLESDIRARTHDLCERQIWGKVREMGSGPAFLHLLAMGFAEDVDNAVELLKGQDLLHGKETPRQVVLELAENERLAFVALMLSRADCSLRDLFLKQFKVDARAIEKGVRKEILAERAAAAAKKAAATPAKRSKAPARKAKGAR